MDLCADPGMSPTAVAGPAIDLELSLSKGRCQTESEGTILLQLLEFKTHVLDAVEELHIRRDAETRFEEQISELMLEKKELEWEKETLQHQAETVVKQHTEQLIGVKKQFQAKIKSIEEEKGKYQVSAELKDKEINNLKEELKSLQLLKFNLEKKTTELEHKLALQSKSKDSHLNQLGEVEKRFSALARLCAMVKQAHEKLEQNVDEAVRRNERLASVNEKQEATILSLKKGLEDVTNQLIKAKMSSLKQEKSHSPPGREQHIQQLHQKVNTETEMNKKLMEENVAVRAEKREVMKALQRTQQLLLSQTQTVSRVELEVQTQREQFQALKQEHKLLREKSEAAEDKLAQLTESYTASECSWDKERSVLLDRIENEQQERQAANEAYDQLRQKHTELSSQAKVQTQLIRELEKNASSRHVCPQLFAATFVKEISGGALNGPAISAEPGDFGSLQPLIQKPDCLDETRVVIKPVATGAAGGQDAPNKQAQRAPNPSNQLTCTVTDSNLFSICSLISPAGRHRHIHNSDTNQSDPDVLSRLNHTSVSDEGLLVSKGSCVSNTSTESSPGPRSVNEDSLSEDKSDKGMTEGWRDEGKGGKNTDGRDMNEEQRRDREELQGEDVKEGRSAEEMRGTREAQTTDTASRPENNQRSTEDVEDTRQPETETKDRAEAAGTDGEEGRAKTGPHMPEVQIPVQTATDTTTEQSDTQQVSDIRHAEPPLAAWALSDCSQSVSQKAGEKVEDSSNVTNGCETRRAHTFRSDERQRAGYGPSSGAQEVQRLACDEASAFPRDEAFEETTEEMPVDNQKLESKQTQRVNPSDMTSGMKQTDNKCEPQHECEKTSPVTADDLRAFNKREARSADSCENIVCDPDADAGDAKTSKSGAVTMLSTYSSRESDASPQTFRAKCYQRSPAKEMLLGDANVLPSNMSYRSAFDWGSTQRKALSSRTKSDVSVLHQFVQGAPVSEQSTSSPEGFRGHPSTAVPKLLKNKPNKGPSVITRASELLNASSFCGAADSSKRHQQGDGKGAQEAAAADTVLSEGTLLMDGELADVLQTARQTENERPVGENLPNDAWERRASPSISSFPVSASSIPFSGLSWQTTPGSSRAPASAPAPTAESDWDSSCSQEQEGQQSSLRAQISKIEQFLNTERLRRPKRPRTDA